MTPYPVILTVPLAAMQSVNRRLIPMRGRLRLSPAYRQALVEARLLVARQWRGPAWTCPVALTIRFYWPDQRRRDESNYCKLLEDALMPRALVDDAQVVETRVLRAGLDPVRPRAELELIPMIAEVAA
jgi:Holliday junction resolvase RusA-like endonuclease